MIHRRFLTAAAHVVAALALVACSSTTDPSGTETRRVTLLVGGTNDVGLVAPSVTVSGRDVVVRGTITTPCLNYGVTASAREDRDTLEVTLTGRQGGEICLTAIGFFPYTASIVGLSSGARTVVVRHRIADANWPVDTVITTRIVIP